MHFYHKIMSVQFLNGIGWDLANQQTYMWVKAVPGHAN